MESRGFWENLFTFGGKEAYNKKYLWIQRSPRMESAGDCENIRMKRLFKRITALASAAALTLSLAACGGSAVSGPKNTAPTNAKPVTITVWSYYNGDQLETFSKLVDEFNATVGKEQNITVEASSQGSVNDLETNVLAAAEGKVGAAEMPNIFSAYADTCYAVDQMGLVADLSGYLTDEEKAAFPESYLTEGDFDDNGTIKIFPVAKSTELLFLNDTDWQAFAAATGAKYEDLSTMEGLVATAGKYYDWTDARTAAPDDGKALFGRDAMANYMLIGAKELGSTLFTVENGKMTVNLTEDVARKLWENYYVPFVKGWFAGEGRFRSDDIKTGNVLAYVGSGYLPVTHAADDMTAIENSGLDLTDSMKDVLANAIDAVENHELYTPKPFAGGTDARKVLEYSMSDLASADRAAVEEQLAAGVSAAEAEALYLTDEYFENWYQSLCTKLSAYEG